MNRTPRPHDRGTGVRRVLACVLVVGLALLVTPRAGQSQTVTGAVLDATTSAPLSGVLVSLLDLNGERVRATLSDEAGRFYFGLGGFGRYSLRAERIGLEPTTSKSFDVVSANPHFERLLVGARPVEITGLLVDSRVQQCQVDSDEAVQIQRWWRDVRTALDVSSVVQSSGLAQFEVDRFQREWDAPLERVVADVSRAEVSVSTRPFASAEARFLSEGGFVQGELAGQREYYAPDAEVLLSSTFLAQHCFSIAKSKTGDPTLVGLAFEPTRDHDVPDIRGTIWVDSTTAELRTLDFLYTSLGEVPENEAGGSVWFEYLPSGAWIVNYWFIRMPKFGQRLRRDRTELELLGYVDVGGEVRPLATSAISMESSVERGAIRGVVWDSIRGRGLADATVSVFGTRLQVTTDSEGLFHLPDVPVGAHRLTFFHDDIEAWGLGSTLIPVVVDREIETSARMAIPSFHQVASVVCLGSGSEAAAVLTGTLVDAQGEALGNRPMKMTWLDENSSGLTLQESLEARTGMTWLDEHSSGLTLEESLEARTGSDGRFVVCQIPANTEVSASVGMGEEWVELFTVLLPPAEIVFRRVMIPVR